MLFTQLQMYPSQRLLLFFRINTFRLGLAGSGVTRLKNELSNMLLVSDMAFVFIVTGLEKMVELEFKVSMQSIVDPAIFLSLLHHPTTF